jgi:hypothetical protein
MPPARRPERLSPERFKIAFTASGEVKDKIERLEALMGEVLAKVIEAAVTEVQNKRIAFWRRRLYTEPSIGCTLRR